MSELNQTELDFVSELADVLHRAMAYARKQGAEEAVSNIMRAASEQATSNREPPKLRILPKPGTSSNPKPRRYPYGFVSGNVAKALLDNPEGLTKEGIRDYCATVLHAEIDPAAIDNTVKQFVKDKKATRTPEGRYKPTIDLIGS